MSAEIVLAQPSPRQKKAEAASPWLSREFRFVVIATLLHLPLGLALYNAGPLAILHPVIVFAAGIVAAANRRVSLANVALFAGYIIGSEVLWRMAHIPVYWESGKYMSAAIMALALVRRRRFRIPPTPALYFLLLLPACFIALATNDLSQAYSDLSFNISGPLLLAVSCWFFYEYRMRSNQLRRLVIVMMIPLFSVAVSTLFFTITNEDIQFTGESNFATSGGFGPNQVSSMLGLGVFLGIAGIVSFERRSPYTAYFAISALFLASMSFMTFSRGGMYNAVGGLLAMVLFHSRDISVGIRRIFPILILTALFVLVIFPYLDSYTGGELEDRFSDRGTTNRWEIMQADLEVFWQGSIWGVGVGESTKSREEVAHLRAISHTELSRLLSEHGIFGLAALSVLVLMAFNNIARPNSYLGKGFVAGAMVWSFLFMMNAGMRLAAPSFMLGLAFLTIVQIRTAPGPNKTKAWSLRVRPYFPRDQKPSDKSLTN